MRISDWSSDVCSSDLLGVQRGRLRRAAQLEQRRPRALGRLGYRHRIFGELVGLDDLADHARKFLGRGVAAGSLAQHPKPADRKSVVKGKSVSVRVDLGGCSLIKKKKTHTLFQSY